MLISVGCYAQDDKPINITATIENKIQKEAAGEASFFAKTLVDEGYSEAQAEYMVDTFKIKTIMWKRMAIDFSSKGITEALYKAGKDYDNLIKKYYKKLLMVISTSGKLQLLESQKSWDAFNAAELKMVKVLGENANVYSHLKTTSYESRGYLARVEARANAIFDAYFVMLANQ